MSRFHVNVVGAVKGSEVEDLGMRGFQLWKWTSTCKVCINSNVIVWYYNYGILLVIS